MRAYRFVGLERVPDGVVDKHAGVRDDRVPDPGVRVVGEDELAARAGTTIGNGTRRKPLTTCLRVGASRDDAVHQTVERVELLRHRLTGGVEQPDCVARRIVSEASVARLI